MYLKNLSLYSLLPFLSLNLTNSFICFVKKSHCPFLKSLFTFPIVSTDIAKTLKFFSKIDESLDKNSHVIIYDFHNKKIKKKKYKHDKGLNVYRWDYKKLLMAMPNYKIKGYIKNYSKKMKDFEEISILKKIKI